MEQTNLVALTAQLIGLGFDKVVPQLEKQRKPEPDDIFLYSADVYSRGNRFKHKDKLEIILHIERTYPLTEFSLKSISAHFLRPITDGPPTRFLEIEKQYVSGKDQFIGKEEILHFCYNLISPAIEASIIRSSRQRLEQKALNGRILTNQNSETSLKR